MIPTDRSATPGNMREKRWEDLISGKRETRPQCAGCAESGTGLLFSAFLGGNEHHFCFMGEFGPGANSPTLYLLYKRKSNHLHERWITK